MKYLCNTCKKMHDVDDMVMYRFNNPYDDVNLCRLCSLKLLHDISHMFADPFCLDDTSPSDEDYV